ncbi:formyl transferase [Cantharellus anzutake]|uniref:formyl transferase n=1 Tax=Cantharellus anzutake TaxID=1750568 RepID=UPI00190486BA|nr:formyl transferase [Cantharellus anzutake]KAF8342824.1 formyl transferase [Cantharellus anzutake]
MIPPFRLYATSLTKPRLNILFLGRDLFSCLNLKILHDASDVWESIHVVTTPDKRVGRRGKDLSVSPLKQVAKKFNLPMSFVPGDHQEWNIPHQFQSLSPANAIITASFGHAVPTSVLDYFVPSLRLNVHPSMLPKYRGAAPIQRAIADGLSLTGVSVLQMEDVALHGFDSGPMWAQKTVAIPPNAYYRDLESLLAYEGAHLLVNTLRNRLHIQPITQNHALASKARLVTKRTATINWGTMDASMLHRLHRAISHQRPLQTVIRETNVSLNLLDISPTDNEMPISELDGTLTEPGDATYIPSREFIVVRCSDNTLIRVHVLQLENRRALHAKEWWNGIRPNWLSDNRILQLGHSPNVGTRKANAHPDKVQSG